MHVSALAEVFEASRRPDGIISVQDLVNRLTHAGLQEWSQAVSSLASRPIHEREDEAGGPMNPWF